MITAYLAQQPNRSRAAMGPRDPPDDLIAQVALTNTFDTDWSTLRSRFRTALIASLPRFLSIGPPPSLVPPSSPVAGSRSPPNSRPSLSSSEREINGPVEDDKPPQESLLLSPSAPDSDRSLNATPATRTDSDPHSTGLDSSASASQPTSDGSSASTHGGLIIPPFPPLESPRRQRSNMSSSPGLEQLPKINGVARPSTGHFDDDWDEDVIIGGKKLSGWMEEEEGKKEVERVAKAFDDMDYPPFTIQRVAELLLDPTLQHSSLGKFLRALEKAMLVTTPWEAPSYTYIPGQPVPGTRTLFSGTTSSASSASSEAGDDEDSMMPPGASTPMFIPIPFLAHGDDLLSMDMEGESGPNGRHLEEGLMSPLILGGESPDPNTSASFQFAPAPNVRSPTPEPEESASALSGSSPPEVPETASESSDPSNQPYLGRVDELDTGPLSPTNTSPTTSTNGGHTERRESNASGTGEGGTMTPHGMSERPVPISSTTTVDDRPIARMPLRTESEESGNADNGENGEKQDEQL